MRSAKIHSIDENEHFAEYAEWNWVDRTTEVLREDELEKWQWRVAIVCIAVLIGVALWPWIARVLP